MRDSFDRLMYRMQNIMLSNIFYKFVTISIAMCWIIVAVSKHSIAPCFGLEFRAH